MVSVETLQDSRAGTLRPGATRESVPEELQLERGQERGLFVGPWEGWPRRSRNKVRRREATGPSGGHGHQPEAAPEQKAERGQRK